MEFYKNQLQEFNFNTESVRKRKGKKSRTEKHSKDILVFDIETTSAWKTEENKIISYEKGKSADYWNGLTPLALPYLWQFSVNDRVFFGREFKDFKKILDALPKDVHFIIWVHNLAFEFHFLCNLLKWEKVFARAPHKPIYAVPEEYPNVTFRCSYMLTRLSLDAWGKQLRCEKNTGDLDYEKLRTPKTKLYGKEIAYGEKDCLVVYAGIKNYLETYYIQRSIPLTQTGTVRREVKNRVMQDKNYNAMIKKLVPRSAKEYAILRKVFAGGYTHANRWHSGEVIKGLIQHYDFASSYPAVMISEKYPMTPWTYTADHELPETESFEDTAFLMLLEFEKIKSVSYNTYIQASKSALINGIFDNGRVISADYLRIWVTDPDFVTIKNNYEWQNVKVLKKYKSVKEYLPKVFTEYILQLYENKTKLKGIPEKEDLYMQSKQYINSLFGMCVTALIQSDIEYDNAGEWEIKKISEEEVEKRLEKLRFPNPREKKYFLSYSWGVYVTAYARRNLWECMESCDDKVIYCDTDSIFVKGENDFEWYNKKITEKIKKACNEMDLDFEKTRPETVTGKKKPLGIFEKEDDCMEFITLGAKRYCERRADGLHLTVSGINKDAVELLNDDVSNFRDGFNFDKDAECVKKRLSTYITDQEKTAYPDGYISDFQYGINLRRNGYNLTMTDEYKDLINYCDRYYREDDEAVINHEKGNF